MTDREKVVSELKSALEWCEPEDNPNGSIAVKIWAVREAVELLKEQEALEPTRVEIEQAGPLYHRCYCQKCGHHVGNMISNKVAKVHENFCSSCGKEVKWNV